MTLEEAKAQAYDAIVQIENWQAKLRELNQLIIKLKEEIKPVEEKK
jgi:hypothetical protein